MGVTISSSIGIEKQNVIRALNRTRAIAGDMQKQAQALNIPFTIRRPDVFSLYIDIGNCETLAFVFKTYAAHAKPEGGWSYAQEALQQYFPLKLLEKSPANYAHLASWPGQELYWASSFCKTQYADNLVEHRYVAELIRSVAMLAEYAHVHDEGDYYHTLEINDAAKAIESNGALIASLGKTLTGLGYEVEKGGDTKIKTRKSAQK